MFHYLRGLLRKAQKSTVKRHVPNRPRCQPRLELLENRLAPSVSVVTNQLDYAPGATALFTASGFDSGASVQFKVVKTNVTPNVVETLWSVTDGGTNDQNSGAGTVGTKWYVNPAFSIGANFTLTATGRSGGVTQTATTTFTDGAASLDQAANGPPAAPLASSSWVNGNLNSNNSHYGEGDTVPFRTDVTGLVNGSATIAASPTGATEAGSTVTITTTSAHGFAPGELVNISGVGAGYDGNFIITGTPTTTSFTYTAGTTGLPASGGGTAILVHFITIQWAYTVTSGNHAYDYLTSFDRLTPNNQTVPNPLVGTGVSGSGTLASATSTFAIPTDTNINGVTITPAPNNNPPVHSPFSQIPGVFAMFDNDPASSLNQIVTAFYSTAPTNQNPIPSPASPPAQQGSALTGTITIGFVTTQSEVVFAWGGHIASAVDWGKSNSATAISGSPYHMFLVGLDGSIGAQDRSIKASAVAGDFITVAKITNPSSDTTTQFPFTLIGPNNVNISFNLTGGSQQLFGPFFDGTYVVTENVPSGWHLTNITVVDPDHNSPAPVPPSATLVLDTGEVINVTYTDTIIANPTFTTTQTPTTATAGSVTVSDSATLSGGLNPTGTFTFDLQNSSNVEVPGYTLQSVTVNGNGTYNATPETVSLPAGTYHWHVVYSGDFNNTGFTVDNETLVVGKASPTFSTTQTPTTATAGSVTVSDSATFSGGFQHTGTISFDLQNASNVEVPGYTQQNITVTGGTNTYNATPETVSLAAGTYHWHVVYSGDANNNGFTLDNETLVVGKASPTFVTSQTPTTAIAGSVTVSDSATFSGGFNHTGTITFDLQNSSNIEVPGYTLQSITVTAGTNTYSTTNETVSLGAGTYHWHVVYSGDANNNGFTLDNETLVIGKASPTFSTTQSPMTATAGGVTVSDSATFSGGFQHTGTISFDLQNSSNAEVPGYTLQSITVAAGTNTYNTTPETENLPTGTYHWHVVYSGDANNNGFTVDNETLVVSSDSPTFSTTQTPSSAIAGSVTVSDSATFSDGFNHTGTISFDLQNSSNVEVPGFTQQNITVTAGTNTYNTTPETVSLGVGTYHWHVVYSGDANNNGFTLDNETLVIGKASPTFSTTQSPLTATAGSVTVSDSATFSDGFQHTGTISFDLQNAGNVEVPGYTLQNITVTAGTNTYNTTPETVSLTTGTYHWHVVYSGDVNNNGFTVDNETLVIGKADTGTATAIELNGTETAVTSVVQGSAVQDDATVTSNSSLTIGGTVTYNFYNTATPVLGTTVPVFTDTEPVGTDSISTGALTVGSYSFIAVYNGDSNFNSSIGPIEPLTVQEARILLTPGNATDAVGDQHVITAEVDTSIDGSTWTPVSGATVTFSLLNNTAGAVFVGSPSGITGGNGQTTATIVSNSPGGVDIHGTTTFTLSGVAGTFTVSSGSSDGVSSPDAHKVYEQARILITPATAFNVINQPHTVTAEVDVSTDGINWTPQANAPVDFSLLNNTFGVFFVGGISSGNTDTFGKVSVQINSNSTGTVTIQATTSFTINGIGGTFSATTGTGLPNSDNATKTYIGLLPGANTDLSKPGDPEFLDLPITNISTVTLFLRTITDRTPTVGGQVLLGNLLTPPPHNSITSITASINGNPVPLTVGLQLPAGETLDVRVIRTVGALDPNPSLFFSTFTFNTVANGTGTSVSATANDTVSVFKPSVKIALAVNKTTANVGDTLTYTVTITNTSTSNSPNLHFNAQNGTDVDQLISGVNRGVVTVADTFHIFAGESVWGPGIPKGTTVFSILSPTQVALNKVVTAGSGPFYFGFGPMTVPPPLGFQIPSAALTTLENFAPGSKVMFSYTHVITSTDPNPLTNTFDMYFFVGNTELHPVPFSNRIHSPSNTVSTSSLLSKTIFF